MNENPVTSPMKSPYFAKYAEVLPGFELGRVLADVKLSFDGREDKTIPKGTWLVIYMQTGLALSFHYGFRSNPIRKNILSFLNEHMSENGFDEDVVNDMKKELEAWDANESLMAEYGRFMLASNQFHTNLQRGFTAVELTALVDAAIEAGFGTIGLEDPFMFVFDYIGQFVENEAFHIADVDAKVLEAASK